MKSPNILTARWFIEQASLHMHRVPPGMAWTPLRPNSLPSLPRRLKAAWLVFTGRADALRWEAGQ